MRIAFRTFLLLSFSVFLLATAASGANFVVNTTDDTADATPGDGVCSTASANCSLRAAISEANALAGDDIITLPAGTYTQALVAANEDLNAGGDWDIRSNLTINGAGAATTILQAAATPGTATERVIESMLTTSVVTINGVTLRHGNKTGAAAATTRGGGIRNVGTLTMNDCLVTLNNASGAGGVRNERVITLNNVTVSNNACNNGGTTCFGGGMYNTLAALSTVTINNSTFTGNTSTSPGANGFGFGAGLGIESATGFNLVITGSTFSNNQGVGNGTGGSNGNGIRVLPTNTSTANITNTTFSGNFGTGGSSIQGSGITVFTSGAAGTITGTWDGLTVDNNTAGASAGGIFLSPTGGAMTFNLVNSTVSNNDAGTTGGGITAVGGAAAAASVTLNITNSTISSNTATSNGGGVSVEQPSLGTATVNFNFATVAGNTAGGQGGGVARVTAGTVNLKNSIIANNAAPTGPDVVGSINSQDYNHFGSTAGATIGGTTTNNATGDPMIGPLANNGGPTLTRLPGAGSPVINTIPNGTNDCGGPITTDQRGVARPSGGSCDKGSVEVAVAAPAYIAGGVYSLEGRAILGAKVTLSGGGLPSPLFEYTNHFGVFRFEGVPTGQTYTLLVGQRHYTFTPPSRNINLTGNLDNENFFASSATLQKGEAVREMGEQP